MGGFYNSFHVRGKTQQEVCNDMALNKDDVKCIIGTEECGWVPVYAEFGFGDSLAQRLSERMQTTVILIDVHDDDVFCYSLYKNGEEIDSFNSCPDYFGEMLTMPDVPDPAALLHSLGDKVQSEFNLIRDKCDFSSCKNQEELMAMVNNGALKFFVNNINSAFREVGFTDTPDDDLEMSSAVDLSGHPERFADLLEKPEDVATLARIFKAMQNHEDAFVSTPGQEFCDLFHLPNAMNSYQYLTDEGIPEGYIRLDEV